MHIFPYRIYFLEFCFRNLKEKNNWNDFLSPKYLK